MYQMCLNLALVVCFDFSENTDETILRMRAGAPFAPQEKADVLFCSSALDSRSHCTVERVFMDNRNVPISTWFMFGGSRRHVRCSLASP